MYFRRDSDLDSERVTQLSAILDDLSQQLLKFKVLWIIISAGKYFLLLKFAKNWQGIKQVIKRNAIKKRTELRKELRKKHKLRGDQGKFAKY